MAKKTRSQLKALIKNGHVLDESDLEDILDSLLSIDDDKDLYVNGDKGIQPFETKAEMDGFTPGTDDPKLAIVMNDSTASNNGWYRWDSSSSSWVARDEFYATSLDDTDTSEATTGKAVGDYVKGKIVEDLDPDNTSEAVTGKAVAEYSLPLSEEKRILKEGYSQQVIDRPDLYNEINEQYGGFLLVDSELKIIPNKRNEAPGYLNHTTDIDRPDIGFAVVDSENKILFNSRELETADGQDSSTSDNYPKLFYEPALQDSFNTNDDILIDYSQLISAYDAIKAERPTNDELEDYITKVQIGTSSNDDTPIYKYVFSPPSPKKKILLVTGAHGSEKVYIKQFYEFFKELTSNWQSDSLLQYIRWNYEFHVIPSMSPESMTGLTEGSTGGRRILETPPIVVSWTEDSGEVTITYDSVDFPDTGGRLDPENYFNNGNIAEQLYITVFDSDDAVVLEDGAKLIQEVVDGKTIKVLADGSGATSGTAKMYVSVDPNRNFDIGWKDYTSGGPFSTYSNEYADGAHSNKGTKPFSISETIAVRDQIQNTNFDLYYEGHSGAQENYLVWVPGGAPIGLDQAVNNIKNYIGQFNNHDYDRVDAQSTTHPYISRYFYDQNNAPAYVIEWAQPSSFDAEESTQTLRWFTTTFFELLKLN